MFDALFNLAHATQILVELLLVPRSKLALQRPGVIEDEIQNAALLFLAALEARLAFTRRAGAEESFEQKARIGLGRHRLGR